MKRFPTLAGAGRDLAVVLEQYRAASNTLVVAIVTGGVPVACEVARQLQLPLELLVIRRLVVLSGEPVCAVNVAGKLVVDERLEQHPKSLGLDHALAEGLEQLAARERLFRGERPPTDLAGMNVLLVDNGIHTGSTVLSAIRALRQSDVSSIVLAVPVANPDSRAVIESVADRVVCLAWPEKFGHVGLWYDEPIRPTEERVRELFFVAQQTCAS
jgi:putative phosphoribosyl transferase